MFLSECNLSGNFATFQILQKKLITLKTDFQLIFHKEF